MAVSRPDRSTRAILSGTRPPLWLLMLFATMSPFSLLLFFPALPPLAEELGVGLGTVGWIVNGFLIGVGTMQLVIGPLVDRLGRRRVVLAGLICFLASSLLAATATEAPLLIGLRVLQAICVASLSVVSRAAVLDLFEGTEAGRAMSYITLCLQLPSLVAPAIGGALVVWAGWPSLFIFLAGLAGLLLPLSWWLLPETSPVRDREPQSLSKVLTDYASLFRSREFATPVAVISLCAAAAMTLLTVFPAALTDLFETPPDVVGYYTSAYSLISVAGALTAARLVSLLGVNRLMTTVLVTATLYLAFYLAWLRAFPVSLPNLFIAVSVVGFAQSIVVSMGFARAVEAGQALRGTASGFAGATSSIVSAAFAAAGAVLYASGLSMSLTIVFGCFLLSSSILGVQARRDRNARDPAVGAGRDGAALRDVASATRPQGSEGGT